MRLTLRNAKGFTLLEILIVIVILAVLAGLAIPAYTSQVEKSRAQEAIQGLEALRGAMLRYFTANSTYATATIRANGGAVAATDLDVDMNNLLGGQNQLFNYTISAQAANTYTLLATRINGRPAGAVAPAGVNTVSVDQAGTVVRGGLYQ